MMIRRYYLILGISMLASAFLFTPSLLAQMGGSTGNHATLSDGINDTAIIVRAKAALTDDKNTSGATDAIHVQSNRGIVTLTGDVASQITAERAQMIVAQLSGVRDVVNDLKYPPVAAGVDSNLIVAPPIAPNR
jgi:hypothetical protein